MSPETVTPYVQALALAVAAILNGLLTIDAYETRPRKIWKIAVQALTAILLAVLAWHRILPIF